MAPVIERFARLARPSSAGRLGAGLLLLALGLLGPASAQTPGDSKVFYARHPSLRIPFYSDPNDRRIRSVYLYVSEDYGKSYERVGSPLTPADKDGFLFKAVRDGWYWFTTQTEDVNGGLFPAKEKMPELAPHIKVCVDTKPPLVTLKAIPAREGAVGVEWDIRDDNPDLSSLRVDYRPAGGQNWIPLPVERKLAGSHVWNAGANGQYEVRLYVLDMAKNPAETTTTVSLGGGGSGTPPKPPTGGGNSATPEAAQGPVMVNKRTFQLNFDLQDVGPSDVSVVEIWRCGPTARDWQLVDTKKGRNAPCAVSVTDDGRYGFTLIAKSGVGYGQPAPVVGDQPQVWVEVDTVPPVVRIEPVYVGRGVDHGTITIKWSARDAHLGGQPITISYAANENGPWTPVAEKIPNDGQYVWRLPRENMPYEFFIKVEAVDLAGNVGGDRTREKVKADLSLPKTRITGVQPVVVPTPEKHD